MTSTILPFLAALKKQTPDFSGMEEDNSIPQLPPPSPDVQPNLNAVPPPSPQQQQQDLSNVGTQTQDERAPKFQETKGHLLMRLLQGGLQGGLNGLAANAQTYAQTGRNAGFGGGFAGATTMPFQQAMMGQQVQRGGLENQLLSNQVAYAPLLQRLGILKSTADLNKTVAETGAIGTKSKLEAAQTEAAYYKEDPNYGLVDLRTQQPVTGQAYPLTEQEAAVLGKQPGDRVPIKIKNTASEIVNRGVHSVSANGRQMLVDSQGNTIKDLGQATPMAVFNAQSATPSTVSPDMQKVVDMVGNNQMDLQTALMNYRRFPGQANALLGALHDQYPGYFQGSFGASKDTLKYFTTGQGATQLTAFRTAIAHADLLQAAAQALNNGDNRTLAGINNRLQTEFGDPKLTTFQAIANAYNHEVSSVISKGHITDKEVSSGDATMPSNANLATITSVTNAYKQLMQSKADNLTQQYEQGRKGQPAFPQTQTAPVVPTHRYNPVTKKIEAI